MDTAIEVITNALETQQAHEGVVVDAVLVPEQCMRIFINGQAYHVTVERLD